MVSPPVMVVYVYISSPDNKGSNQPRNNLPSIHSSTPNTYRLTIHKMSISCLILTVLYHNRHCIVKGITDFRGSGYTPPPLRSAAHSRSRSAPGALVCAPSPWSALAPCSGCASARAALACGRRACPAPRLAPSGLCACYATLWGGVPVPCAYRGTPLPFLAVFGRLFHFVRYFS